MPIYAGGAKVETIHPVIPISDGHAIAIGVLTYREALHFAAYVDPEALPDAGELGTLFANAVGELAHTVGRQRRMGATRPARRPAPGRATARQ